MSQPGSEMLGVRELTARSVSLRIAQGWGLKRQGSCQVPGSKTLTSYRCAIMTCSHGFDSGPLLTPCQAGQVAACASNRWTLAHCTS